MVSIKNLFKAQLIHNKVVTEEILNELNIKKYFNGDDVLIGDQILYAMLVGEPIERENDLPEISINLINLNERHFNLVEPYPRAHDTDLLPIIQLVKKI